MHGSLRSEHDMHAKETEEGKDRGVQPEQWSRLPATGREKIAYEAAQQSVCCDIRGVHTCRWSPEETFGVSRRRMRRWTQWQHVCVCMQRFCVLTCRKFLQP